MTHPSHPSFAHRPSEPIWFKVPPGRYQSVAVGQTFGLRTGSSGEDQFIEADGRPASADAEADLKWVFGQ